MRQPGRWSLPNLRGILTLLGLAAMLLAGASVGAADRLGARLQRWTGKSTDPGLRKFAPSGPFIPGAATWTRVWSVWRRTESRPRIDFRKDLVLVSLASGPNSVQSFTSSTPAGAVRVRAVSTLIGGAG